MREILFRGKRIDNGEWVCGYYICKQDPLLPGIDTNVIVTFDENSMSVWNKVDPATVGQDTGLTDKNGKKIFEGDIVRYIYEPGEGFWNVNQLSVVVWEHTGFRLDGIIGTNKFALLTGWLVSVPCNKNFFEVIGNVHDTPDLLEKKEASNAPPN